MLLPRILSALVMAPLALLAAWVGGYVFAGLVAVAGGLMVWEWQRMTSPLRAFDELGRAVAVAMVVAPPMMIYRPELAVMVVAVAVLYALFVGRSRWLTAGALYVGIPILSLVWLRDRGGLATLIWLFAVVWGTDIGAYAAGRLIGGAKIAPTISPSKTWAGLFGGMTTAAIAAAVGGVLVHQPHWLVLAIFGAGLAVIAQIGDFFESWVKRRAGVKDSSHLIPGHGGVLDRVDGLIAVAPLVALAVVVFKGGLETW